MGKFVFWALIALLVAWRWSSLGRKAPPPSSPPPSPNRRPTDPQPMVACAHCGLHLPQEEACAGVQGTTLAYFCTEQHRRLAGHTPAPEA